MDFNGNNQSLNHLINIRRRPQTARQAQDILNEQRFNRILAILATRPHFCGLKFSLPLAASISPITNNTPDFRHDFIITGAITNSQRPFEIERRNSRRPQIYIESDDFSTRFKLNEFAGEIVPSGGYNGVFYFPHPLVIEEGRFETFKVYKLDADPVEFAWLALVGLRVYADTYAEAQLTEQQISRVREAINSRPTPKTHFAKIAIEFDGDGRASFKTPKFEEPHILRGIKSTFNESLIRFGLEGEGRLTSNPDEEGLGDYVPIWAVTSQPDNPRELYSWQQRGMFIDSNKRLYGELINTLDEGATVDTNGEITLILETM